MKKINWDIINFIIKLFVVIWEFICKWVKRPKTSIEKYLFYSLFRKNFNNIHLSKVDIIYTFKDGMDPMTFGMDIEYNYTGSVYGNSISGLLLYLSMKTYNRNNISLTAFDGNIGVTPRISQRYNHNKAYGDNGAYWEVPFHGNSRNHMDSVSTKLKISWKNFCPHGEIDTLIIDPRNYAQINKIDEINIVIKNDSKNCNIGSIMLLEYNRKSFKYKNRTDLYSIGNMLPEPNTLVKHQISKKNFDENKVFVIKCEQA